MTVRTESDLSRAAVRRLIADALLVTANAAVRNGATPDDAGVALLASAINFNLDLFADPQQLVIELRRLADEVDQMPASGRDKRSERLN